MFIHLLRSVKHKTRMILFISLCVCAGQVSQAQQTLVRPFLGVTAGYTFIAGSFDGESFFQMDEDIMLVPAIRQVSHTEFAGRRFSPAIVFDLNLRPGF